MPSDYPDLVAKSVAHRMVIEISLCLVTTNRLLQTAYFDPS